MTSCTTLYRTEEKDTTKRDGTCTITIKPTNNATSPDPQYMAT